MQIHFHTDTTHILQSISECAEFADELREKGMFVHFPFTEHELNQSSVVLANIESTLASPDVQERLSTFMRHWGEVRKSAHAILEKYCSEHGNDCPQSIDCVLTPYGPYGYYLYPHTVFVNISRGSSEFLIETLLHEILHLIIEQSGDSLDQPAIERRVDDTFTLLFGHILPNYKKQDI